MNDARALLDRAKTRIVAEMADARQTISSGACTSFEEYKKRCGLVSGLGTALAILSEEYESQRRGQDDDDPGDT